MRTTLTLDPDVARLLEAAAHRQRKSLKELVNEAIRRCLGPRGRRSGGKRYKVRPQSGQLRPGLDPVRLNALADQSEDEAILAKVGKRRRA